LAESADYELEIQQRFGGRGYQAGNLILFDIPTAKEVVGFCATREIAVVGLEGFVVDDGIHPLLDYIAYWDEVPQHPWPEYVKKCRTFADKALDRWAETAPDNLRVRIGSASQEELASMRLH
jgi:hypothetical protein